MTAPTRVDVGAIIDNSRIGPFQLRIFALCFLCLAMDGFDVQSLGYVAPALSADLGISRVELGPVLSAAPFGVLFGSILCSMLADKIGRRPVLIGSTAVSSRRGSCRSSAGARCSTSAPRRRWSSRS